MIQGAQVVIATDRFDDDLAALTERFGFRVDAIYPADSPSTGIVSGHGVRLRLEASDHPRPVTLHLLSDEHAGQSSLPGGTTIEYGPATTTYALPGSQPSLVVTRAATDSGAGRAGMRYRDLLPDRWGGRFIASHITIPEGGPVPDYVHFHKIRFQMIFVRAGWVRVVYEDQGEPFVMVAGDCVLQPPEIRHRVLEASSGLEVIEIGCPALHETIADWSLPLPNAPGDSSRTWDGQRFVRHVAADAPHAAWRQPSWECRDTGIAAATGGLAAVRVARPTRFVNGAVERTTLGTELTALFVLRGAVTLDVNDHPPARLGEGDFVAVPGDLAHRLIEPSDDCELLDVTLPAL